MESITELTARIISKSSREHPADSVLRSELRKQRGLSPFDAREISQTVFTYFRWFGWLDARKSLGENIKFSLRLAQKFALEPQSFSDQELVKKSVPDWIHEQMEISPAFARALQQEPRLWLRAKNGMAASLARRLDASRLASSVNLSSALEYSGEEDLFKTPEFQAGEFELQDISSQAVGIVCDPKPGETWWDACAGEGGKMLHLSDLMQNKGLMWASDRAEWRLKKLKQRAARAKAFNYRTVFWNGGEKPPIKTKFDGVLVDAPCSGIGTWQRNPHARWTTTLQDVRELAAIQERLLLNVKSSLKPGGKLIYSVCTLSRAETTDVVAGFEKQLSELKRMPLADPFHPRKGPQQELWFGPQDCGGNGMFVVAWVK